MAIDLFAESRPVAGNHHRFYADTLNAIADPVPRKERLCELNVIEQVSNICNTTMVRKAWRRNQSFSVHGWIYRLEDGLIKDLGVTASDE